MGNTLGGRRTARVMKMDGETIKLKTPIRAGEVARNHPGLVVMDSRAVRLHGVRAKPLAADQNLEPKRVYFLVELPKSVDGTREGGTRMMGPRRVRSGINMSAKDRLESLMLSRRSVSDMSAVRPANVAAEGCEGGGAVRVRVRLPRTEVERVVRESKDEAEAAEKIMRLCKANADPGMARFGGVRAREHKRVSFLTSNEGHKEDAEIS